MPKRIDIIGAGLAGCEAAYYLAERGFIINLFEMKPEKKTPAHHSVKFAELVCSNSLKSNDCLSNACGLLKEEMRRLGSLIIEAADNTKVEAGGALAVDRDKFADYITERIKNHQNIKIITGEVKEINLSVPTMIATGPLTSVSLLENLKKLTGINLYFYDASAPIVTAESIDMRFAFHGARYKPENKDYINCVLLQDEYNILVKELISAEKVKLKDFEDIKVFEGCMPVEEMAKRGNDTLRFGPLKPVGLYDPATGKRPYAAVQLRKENAAQSLYNLVGFQTNLTFSEQKRVFGIIPALKNAEYMRYGVMHKNAFINSPELLNKNYSMRNNKNIFFIGQLSGVEGYVESAASGLTAAINIVNGTEFNSDTMIGALAEYITRENTSFQPINANYGILNPITERNKEKKKVLYYERSIKKLNIE